jgi:hypothetical protein
MKDPEWAEIVDGIAYQDHGGKVTFGFAKNHPAAARAHELEYGTPTESAHSIFRKVLVGQRPEIERNFKRGMP